MMGLVFVSSTVRVVLAGLYDSFIRPMAKFLEDDRDVQGRAVNEQHCA